MPDTPELSLIIPVFNEEGNIEWFYHELSEHLKTRKLNYELIYVNDGSSDRSAVLLEKIANDDKRVRYIEFSRNFGKEVATTAGLHRSRGKAVMMLDADGQHPLEMIGTFLEEWKKGHDIVIGVRRTNQKEGPIKRYGSKLFYKVLNMINGGNTRPGTTDFRLLDRRVVDEFNRLTEHGRITRGLIDWLGFDKSYVPFDAKARYSGTAAYNYRKLVRLALHAFVSQSTKPLLFTGLLGVFVMALALALGILFGTERFLLHDPLHWGISGSALLAIFLSFLVGIVLACQGLLALYIESIYHEAQNRPLYITRREIN